MGTDWPCPMDLDDAVPWIRSLESLTADERRHPLEDRHEVLGL